MDARVQVYSDKMQKAYEFLEADFAAIRAGRANPHVLDKLRVDYYGTPTPIQQVGNVTVPEARIIQIAPWEKSLIKEIEKAIMTSDIGINPSNDGSVIRLVFPELTEERRKDLVKEVKKKGEEGKVAIRNIRRDGNDAFKKLAKTEVSEDEIKGLEDDLQKLTDKYVKDIDEEYNTCKELNIPCELHRDLNEVPFNIKAALEFYKQGQFNPKKYIDGLAKVVKELGVEIYDNTPIVDVNVGEICEVKSANNHTIKTKNLIIASSNAWYDGLMLYFSKEEASRSYLICSELKENILEGNFINVEEPTITFRTHKDDNGKDFLIIGGQDHKTGKCDNEKQSFDKINKLAKERFKIGDIISYWSAQDYVSFDSIPYIGRVNKKQNNIYIVTGTSKWGLSNGSVGAMVIKDLITKNSSKYEELYNPSRLKSYLNTKFIEHNLEVAYDYLKGKLLFGNSDMPKNNEGKVVSIHGKRYGAYRDEKGELFIVDITCTHLGCELRFNSSENTWDCPCHGSRFDYKGNILNGPALKSLKSYGEGKNHIDPKLI